MNFALSIITRRVQNYVSGHLITLTHGTVVRMLFIYSIITALLLSHAESKIMYPDTS